jgi:FMN phosphatase YigB (HAD superfamily)
MEQEYKLYSFDIFDTLITRKLCTPNGIFADMQESLNSADRWNIIPERLRKDFYFFRMQAERMAHKKIVNKTPKEISIQEIYDMLQRDFDLSDQQKEALTELEFRTELKNSVPIPENIEKIIELCKQGKNVILISDMYLSLARIRELLCCHNEIFRDIRIYVSSESGYMKNTGELYKYIYKQEHVTYDEWFHMGDDPERDVKIPGKMGIHTQLFPKRSIGKWSQQLVDAHEDNLGIQKLYGCVKAILCREDILPFQIGAEFSALLLFPYVNWLLNQCIKSGRKGLYFIARDAYILKEIADIIINEKKLNIKTYYIYGSRKAWKLPGIDSETFDMRDFLRWSYAERMDSLEELANIFELSFEEISSFLSFSPKPGKRYGRQNMNRILEMLIANEKQIGEMIVSKQAEKRSAVEGYLKQSIKEPVEDMAFVELVGSGYTQGCLANLMNLKNEARITTFFYRIDNPKGYEKCRNISFCSNNILFSNSLEALCGAMHGQTVSYEKNGNFWNPVLEKNDNQMLEKVGYRNYQNGVRQAAVSMAKWLSMDDLDISSPQIVRWLWEVVFREEGKELFRYISDIPYSVTGKEKKTGTFLPRPTNRMLRWRYLWNDYGRVKKEYYGNSVDMIPYKCSRSDQIWIHVYQTLAKTFVGRKMKNVYRAVNDKSLLTSRYELLGRKIVIYGAGKKGKLLYEQLTKEKRYHSDIVLWIDSHAEKYRKEGWMVKEPKEISHAQYDQIVIAIASEENAMEIKAALMDMGVRESTVYWLPANERYL